MASRTVSVRNSWVSAGNVFPADPTAKKHSIHFSSLDAFADYCEKTEPWQGSRKESLDKSGGESWVDSKNYAEGLHFARFGNPELTKKVVSQRKDVEIDLRSGEFMMRDEYLPAGAVPDVPLYLAGDPCYMRAPEAEEDLPIISIAFCCSYHCGIKSETVFNYGAAMMNLIDHIESTGVATVELVCYLSIVEDSDTNLFSTVVTKRAGQGESPDTLAFALCSSSLFRRLGFRLLESFPNQQVSNQVTHSAYGYPRDYSHVSEYDDFFEDFDVVIPRIEGNASPDQIKKTLYDACHKSPAIKKLFVAED